MAEHPEAQVDEIPLKLFQRLAGRRRAVAAAGWPSFAVGTTQQGQQNCGRQ